MIYGRKPSLKKALILLILILIVLLRYLIYNAINSHFIQILNDILVCAQVSGTSLILIDPQILIDLRVYQENEDTLRKPVLTDYRHSLLNFALFSAVFKEKVFLSELLKKGFIISRFLSENGKISHFHIRRSFFSSNFLVTVLHPFDSGYWRVYKLTGRPSEESLMHSVLPEGHWNTLKRDRLIKRFESDLVTLEGINVKVPENIGEFLSSETHSEFIPCNQSRSSQYYSLYPEQSTVGVKRVKERLWKTLANGKSVLDKLGISFWLSSGTLLGFYRQCDIIPWSLDVDIGVFIEDFSPLIKPSFEEAGFKLVHQLGVLEDGLQLSFRENGIKLDIFFFYDDGGDYWNGGTQVRTRKKFKYTFKKFDLCWTEFLKLRVRIPCQTEAYIKANYGDHWFKPIQRWDWKLSPNNVKETGIWSDDEFARFIFEE